MPDWTGSGRSTAEIYTTMAEDEMRGVSPSYEVLCLAVAGSETVCALLDMLPTGKRQPNLLLGTVRSLDGPVDDPDDFLTFVAARWGTIEQVMLTRRTQTNEPGRCTALLPLLAGLSGPLALLEVGASAGLCLYPDRYAYRYTSGGCEHHLGDSEVVLPCSVTGPMPMPAHLPEVAWRAGLDLNPLRLDQDEDRRWLASLIWPEQTERAVRLDRASAILAAEPPRIVAGDLLTGLPNLVDDVPDNATLVVFHSAVLAYLDRDQRREFAAVMQELQAHRDIHWISNEAPGVVEGTEISPTPHGRFVLAHDGVPVAVSGAHGQSLDWIPRDR